MAASAGADLIKFQTFNAKKSYKQKATKAQYQMREIDDTETQFEMLRGLEFTTEMHERLIAHCDALELTSSPPHLILKV